MSDTFTTTADYQDRLSIPVYEGERKMTKYNRLLGELMMTDIPPAPRGVPKIKVTFELDQNGILKVVAQDQATKKSVEIEIKKSTLSADEIDEMTANAEQNQKEDEEFMERQEATSKLTSYVESIKTQLGRKEVSQKLKSQDKNAITEKVKSTVNWLNSKGSKANKESIEKALKSLRKVVDPIMSKLYGGEGKSDDDEEDPSSAFGFDDSASADDQPIEHDEL